MTGFVRDLVAPEPNLDPIGNVVVLEDTDSDGKMDKRTVFADGLILPRAVKVLDNGVLVGEPGDALVHARHQRRPEGRHDARSSRTPTAGSAAASKATRTASSGASTT